MDAKDFEKKYGTEALLKVALSVVNKTLVAKGLVSEKELQKAMETEIKERLRT